MLIGEVGRRAGVNASAIRYYERIGLLGQPARLNGRRQYSADVIERLRLIRWGKELGFTLKELRGLSPSVTGAAASSVAWQRLAHRKIQQVRRDIELRQRALRSLEEALLCGCASLAVCQTLPQVRLDSPSSEAVRISRAGAAPAIR